MHHKKQHFSGSSQTAESFNPQIEMNIVMTASEMTPFAKTGGLGDVMGTLPYALSQRGHAVFVFIPYYRCVQASSPKFLFSDQLEMGQQSVSYSVFQIHQQTGVHVYAIRKEVYFDREFLYGPPEQGYEDNAERFIFFSKAVLRSIQSLGLKTDVIHAHDWQTAFLPVLMHAQKTHGSFPHVSSVFTIHNLAYQGVFDMREAALTHLDAHYFSLHGLEFYGHLNLMKGGILFADAVTTVSRRYAQEIQTSEYGYGLEGVLRERRHLLHGITNGVDYSVWNPEQDRHLPQTFGITSLEGKRPCKIALARELKMEMTQDDPIFGIVTRFAKQKGIDLILAAFPKMLEWGARFAILASGDQSYEKAFQELAIRYPKQIGLRIGYDEGLAHRIYAGSDFYLMPSLYEPCGLSQLYAMRYGAIPVVRATGGLDDTVQQWNPKNQTGDGIKFQKPESDELLTAFEQALQIYRRPKDLSVLRQNAMKMNFSWDQSVVHYETLYQSLQSHA